MERKHGQGSLFTRPTLKNFYIAYYREDETGHKKQIVVNTGIPKAGDTDDETKANLLKAEGMLEREIAKRTLDLRTEHSLADVKYSDMRAALIQRYEQNGTASLYTNREGKKSVMGVNWLDAFFDGKSVKQMADMLPRFAAWVQKRDDVKKAWAKRVEKEVRLGAEKFESVKVAERARNASINRSLSTLRSMYASYSAQHPKRLGESDIPRMPKFAATNSDNVRQGFLNPEDFEKLLAELPEHTRPLASFMYLTGMRSGAAKQLLWEWVEFEKIKGKEVATRIMIPAGKLKNKLAWEIPLVGPLEAIADLLAHGFRAKGVPVFAASAINFRRHWNHAAAKLGMGIYNPKTQEYVGITPHDLRRSAARNLIRAGVPQAIAQSITGHKTPSTFTRYNIVDGDDKAQALAAVGSYITNRLAEAKSAGDKVVSMAGGNAK